MTPGTMLEHYTYLLVCLARVVYSAVLGGARLWEGPGSVGPDRTRSKNVNVLLS